MMYSLTETTRRLHIGKRRLYQLLESEGITPTLKSGHKLLSEDDFQHISKALKHGHETFPGIDQNGSSTARDTAPHGSDTASEPTRPMSESTHETSPVLFKRMSSEIEHLRQMLANEQEERRAERKERENYQQMVMVLQTDLKHARQELLEAPRQQSLHVDPVAGNAAEPVDFAEAPSVSPQTNAESSSGNRGSRFFGVGLSVAAILAVLFYAAITNGGEWLSSTLEQKISAVLKVNGTEPDIR